MTYPFASIIAALTLAAAPLNAPRLPGVPSIDTVAAFDAICLKQQDMKASFATAREMGFVTPPKVMGAALRSSAMAPDAEILWTITDGALLLALAADQTNFPDTDLAGGFCAVVLLPADSTAVARLEAQLAIGAGDQHETFKMLLFSENPQGRKRIQPGQLVAIARLVEKQELNMVMYGQMRSDSLGENATLLMRLRPKPK